MKVCSKCKKQQKFFFKNQHVCKICQKEYCKINKNKITIYHKKYYKENKNKIKETIKNNRKNNIEKFLLRNAKNRARRKNISFSLTEEDLKNKRPKNDICPLLNIKMKTNINFKKDNSFSIDRIDSNKGYDKNNFWIISNKANSSKNNSNIEEYKKIVFNLENLIILENNNNKYIEANLQYIKDDAKRRAKKKDLDFNLDKEYLKLIYPIDNRCPLLNINFRKGKNRSLNTSPTLDRVDPKLGYIKGNVVFISHRANTIKNNLTLDEMKLLLKNWKNYIKNQENNG